MILVGLVITVKDQGSRSYQGISLFAGVNDTLKGQYEYHPSYTYRICLY